MNTFQRDAIRRDDVIRYRDRKAHAIVQARVTRRFRDGKLSIEQLHDVDPDNGEPCSAPMFAPASIFLSDVVEVLSRNNGQRI